MATTMKHLEQRLNALEQQNAALRAELDRMRPAAPKAEAPWPREIAGAGGTIDAVGRRIVPDINTVDPRSTTVGGGGGFGYVRQPNGNWRDGTGIERDANGAIITPARSDRAAAMPQRTPAHERDVRLMDSWLPVGPARRPDDDED